MTHRALSIADAFVSKLQAASSLAAAVYRHRTLSLSADDQELPAVCVQIGADTPTSDFGADNFSFIDSLLTLTVGIVASAPTESELVDELFRLRAAVHVALMADRTQGLAYVIDTRYGGAEPIETNTDGGLVTGRLDTRWLAHYRMNVTDPN